MSWFSNIFTPSKKRPNPDDLSPIQPVSYEEEAKERPRKLVKRMKQVVETEPIKVKVMVDVLEPCTRLIKVRTQKHFEEEAFEEVEEEYTVMEPATEIREKIVWEKQITDEEYEIEVPVVKTRMVSRPCKKIVEQWDEVWVEVPATKVVTVEGFRLDGIEETKVVQVNQRQEYKEFPVRVGGSGDNEANATNTDNKYSDAPTPLIDSNDYDVDFPDDPGHDHDDSSRIRITDLDLQDESVTLTNLGDQPVDLDGWRICDDKVYRQKAKRNNFEFGEFILAPGDSITLHSGPGSSNKREYDDETHVHWMNYRVWDDVGDIAHLIDASGDLVQSYPVVLISAHDDDDDNDTNSKLRITRLDLKHEVFTVTNTGNEPVSMNGYTVTDQENHDGKAHRNQFSFADKCPDLVLNAGECVSVYTGPQSDNARPYDNQTKVHWMNNRVWNDTGDAAFLHLNGGLVQSYPVVQKYLAPTTNRVKSKKKTSSSRKRKRR